MARGAARPRRRDIAPLGYDAGEAPAPVGGGAALLANETDGLGVDFTYATDASRVAVKTVGVVVESTLEPFFVNTTTTPKLVYDVNGVLVWAPHNMFLNSGTPATQSVTTLVAAVYTVTVTGTGSLTGSSGAGGVATAGSPLVYVATGTTSTFTLAGSLTTIQMNRGGVATAYLATTAAARYSLPLDYHPTTHAVMGLLGEAAATNVALRGRDLTHATWVKTNMTTALDQVGADGMANAASKLTATAANATVLQSITLASSSRKMSAFVKRVTGTGAVEMTTDNGTTWTAVTATASWTRVEIPAQTVTNPVIGFRIVTSGDAVAVDFVQNEVGPIVTSPYPAYSVAVTRAVDSISCPTSSFPFDTTLITVILNAAPRGGTGTSVAYAGLSDNTSNERHNIDTQTGSRLARLFTQDGGVTQVDVGVVAVPVVGQFYKIGVGIALNNFAVVVDGGTPVTDVAGTLPTVNKLYVASGQGALPGNSHIRQLTVLPRRMTNAELQTATA